MINLSFRILLLTCITLFVSQISAQDIEAKLGGKTAAETYDVKDSDGTALFTVQGDGKVGIGTTNPLSQLSVGGDGHSLARISGETSGSIGIGMYGKATGYDGFGVYGYAANTSNTTNYGGYFWAEGSTGRGVYGSASNTGDVENYGGYFEAAGHDGRGVYGHATYTSDASNFGGYFRADGTVGYGVYGSASGAAGRGVTGHADGIRGIGVIGYGGEYDFDAMGPGVNYGSTSSIRWKKDIMEIDKPLEKIAELRGVYFTWDEGHGGQHDVGMIAEEVGKVLPEIVVYEENGIDADGMDYSMLTPLLVEAVKALLIRVEELENKIQSTTQ
jgi:hypothetical protein